MTYQEWLGFMQQYLQSVEKYSSIYSGQQIDTAIGKALNPDTTPTASSSALITSSAVKSAIDNVACRPNLLDNWYFVGGGSQQGGGQFPINQRGETSYNGAGYVIDRWFSVYGQTILNADGVRRVSDAAYGGLFQYLEPSALLGQKVTFSLLLKTGGTYGESYCTFYLGDNTYQESAPLQDGLVSATVIFPSQMPTTDARFGIDIVSMEDSDFTIVAAKLELGSNQTLAHQENGVWVLNEIPNYEEQLIRCKSSTADSSDTYANDPVAFKSAIDAVKSTLVDTSESVSVAADTTETVKTLTGLTPGNYIFYAGYDFNSTGAGYSLRFFRSGTEYSGQSGTTNNSRVSVCTPMTITSGSTVEIKIRTSVAQTNRTFSVRYMRIP